MRNSIGVELLIQERISGHPLMRELHIDVSALSGLETTDLKNHFLQLPAVATFSSGGQFKDDGTEEQMITVACAASSLRDVSDALGQQAEIGVHQLKDAVLLAVLNDWPLENVERCVPTQWKILLSDSEIVVLALELRCIFRKKYTRLEQDNSVVIFGNGY